MIFLGTPHLGAPLERGGPWLEELLDRSPYSAPFPVSAGSAAPAGIDLLPYLQTREPPPLRSIFARHFGRGPLRAARLAGSRKEILFDRHAPYQPVDEADRAIWQRDVARLAPRDP